MGFGKLFKMHKGDNKFPKTEISPPSPQRNPQGPLNLPNSYTPKPSPTREASKTSSKEPAATTQEGTQTSQAVQALQDFALQVLKVKCRRCSTPLLRNFSAKAYVRDWSTTATSRDTTSICVATCPSCTSKTCLGCGEAPVYNAPKNVREYGLSWCCTSGRLFGIWVLLGRYDDVELQLQGEAKENLEKHKKEEELKQRRNLQISSYGPNGLMSSGGLGAQLMGPNLGTVVKKPPIKGVGYDDDENVYSHGPINLYYDGEGRPPGLLAQAVHFDQQDSKTDNLTCLILSLVTVLLPNGTRRKLPPELKAMIEISLILDKVAELLRNDSLDNVTRRYELYSAAMNFTARLACNPELSYLVNEARFAKRKTAGLQAVSEAALKNKATNDVLILGDELLSSIGKGLGNLVQQAHIVLRAGKSGALRADGGQAMLDICKEIIDLHNQLVTQSPAVESDFKYTETVEERYMQYCKGHCVTWDDSIPDLIERNLRYEAGSVSQFSSGKAKKLMTEIATMSTSLPPGVFVKVGESRTDIMKALIMGPKDSPYGYGMFEFDIFCPSQYPAVPPKVLARAGCGIWAGVHLNPNIHPDGKVCLSLLGTWRDGDEASKWQPNISTILQVLITIQAMLFCEDPWRNEPGNGSATGKDALETSRRYQMRRQPMTIRYGMIEWLHKLRRGEEGIWDDIVRTHFKINGGKILENVEEWKKDNTEIEQWGGWIGTGVGRISGFGMGRSTNLWMELQEQLRMLA